MSSPETRYFSRREATALALLLLVYALLVAAMGLVLRSQLRGQLLTREAEAFQALITLKLDAALEDVENDALAGTKEAAFEAVLEASRLRGVLAARLFDEEGELHSALPLPSAGALYDEEGLRLARELALPRAKLHPDSPAGEILFGKGPVPGAALSPLLELTVPVPLIGDNHRFCVAHFWLDGAPLALEFSRIDRSLLLQAGLAFLAGSAALAACLLWALRRLAQGNAALQSARDDLLRANRELAFSARTSALGTISAHLLHDLKNPLLGLEGFIEDGSAGQTHDGPAWREAREAARRLRALVSETLELLRQESLRADAPPRPLADLLAELLEPQAAKARQAGVTLRLECHSGALLPARSASLLSLALRNLLGNALEASPEGGAIVLLAHECDGSLCLDLSDQGPGIPSEQQAGLFQAGPSSKPGGSGLGLALSHHLALHAGARLELLSSSEKGSCFRLSLPLGHLTGPTVQ